MCCRLDQHDVHPARGETSRLLQVPRRGRLAKVIQIWFTRWEPIRKRLICCETQRSLTSSVWKIFVRKQQLTNTLKDFLTQHWEFTESSVKFFLLFHSDHLDGSKTIFLSTLFPILIIPPKRKLPAGWQLSGSFAVLRPYGTLSGGRSTCSHCNWF